MVQFISKKKICLFLILFLWGTKCENINDLLTNMEKYVNPQMLIALKSLIKKELKSEVNGVLLELKSDKQLNSSLVSYETITNLISLTENNINKFENSENSFEEIKYLQSLIINFSDLETNLHEIMNVDVEKIESLLKVLDQVINFIEENIEKFQINKSSESNSKSTENEIQSSSLSTYSPSNVRESHWSIYIAIIIVFVFLLIILYKRCKRKADFKEVDYVQYKSEIKQISDF
jgi:hypothetical protein